MSPGGGWAGYAGIKFAYVLARLGQKVYNSGREIRSGKHDTLAGYCPALGFIGCDAQTVK